MAIVHVSCSIGLMFDVVEARGQGAKPSRKAGGFGGPLGAQPNYLP